MLLGIILLFTHSNLIAQSSSCPDNIDFEQGTLNSWELYTGTCCPISTPTLSGPVSGRHTLTGGVALDAFGGFPTVSPGGGSYSLLLGNTSTGKEAERARYYIHVPSGTGKYILLYRYAVVLEEPGHSASDQPRFEVKAYDSVTNTPISCNQFSYVASSVLPGFSKSSTASPSGSPVYYKPWTSGTLNLTGLGGKTIAIDFSSGDCALGGHFGYGYVDMNCGLFEVYALKCNGSSTLSLKAPTGYAHYKWMNASLTTVIDTFQNISIPAPSGPTTYAVILTPYSGYGCPDTLYTTYVVATTTATANHDTTICLGQTIQLAGTGTSTDMPLTYSWAPILGLSCFNCQSTITTPLKTTSYFFTATSKAGCAYVDTVKVTVDTVVLASLSVSDDSICLPKDIDLKNLFNNPPNATYTWSIDATSVIHGGTRDSLRLTWADYGAKKIKLNVVSGVCNSSDSLIVGAGPPIYGTPLRDTTICYGSQIQLSSNLTSAAALYYQWTPSAGLSCICDNPTVAPTVTGQYILRANNLFGCVYRDTAFVVVDTVVFTHLLYSKDTLCPKEPVYIWSKYRHNSTAAAYKWTIDTAMSSFTFYTRDSAIFSWTTAGVKKMKLNVSYAGCSVSDSLNIFVRVTNHVIAPGNINACIGDSIRLSATVSPPIANPYYYWAPANDLTCTNCANPVSSTRQSKRYSVTILNEKACADIAYVNVSIDSNLADIIAKDKVCQHDSILIKNKTSDSVFSIYTWTLDTGKILYSNKTGVIRAGFYAPGNNRVILKVKSWGCTSYDTAYLQVLPAPIANSLVNDTGCVNDTVVIAADKINGSYHWTIDEQDIKDTVYKVLNLKWGKPGIKNIVLVVKDTAGCSSLPFITSVDMHNGPRADISKLTEDKACKGDKIPLITPDIDNCTYQWQPAGYFENANKPQATLTVPKSINASVYVTNEWGCVSIASSYIDADGCCKVFMPNAFSPNNDGHNDTYRPLGIDKQQLSVFMIANRWGEIIFTSTSPTATWDGKYKNQPVEPGTYFYYLKYTCDDQVIEEKGDVLLLR